MSTEVTCKVTKEALRHPSLIRWKKNTVSYTFIAVSCGNNIVLDRYTVTVNSRFHLSGVNILPLLSLFFQ